MTQNNLGLALRDQADESTGPARPRLLREAAAAMRDHLSLFDKAADPDGHAARERWLAEVEAELAKLTSTPTPP